MFLAISRFRAAYLSSIHLEIDADYQAHVVTIDLRVVFAAGDSGVLEISKIFLALVCTQARPQDLAAFLESAVVGITVNIVRVAD